MKVFISWSGERSRLLAEALREWLPLVINAIEPWTSSADIAAGARWNSEVARELEESRVGIFCLTEENLASPWIHFEAGAIAKDQAKSFACTLLLGVTPTQVTWPLAQFQAKETDKKSLLELVATINSADPTSPLLREDHLRRAFDKWWPELDEKITAIPKTASGAENAGPSRSTDDMIAEVLSLLRGQERVSTSNVASDNRPKMVYYADTVEKFTNRTVRDAITDHARRAIVLLGRLRGSLVKLTTVADNGTMVVEGEDISGKEYRIVVPFHSMEDIRNAPTVFQDLLDATLTA